MPRETIDETRAEIRRLGVKLGIPADNVTDAIKKCADDSETRALRRKWTTKARSLDHQYARGLRAVEDQRWSEQAIADHGERMVQETHDRRAHRARMTLGVRLDAALNGIGAMSTVGSSAGGGGGGGRSSERPAGPPKAEQLDVGQEITAIRTLVELVEDRWDAERGLLAPVDYLKMPVADKNRLLARLAGVHAKTVAEMFPFLGGERTIRNYRREWGVIPATGLPKDETQTQTQTQEAEAA